MPELNLGGGFGIAYTSADDPTPIEEIALGIADAVASGCRALGVPVPKLAFEPGRSIIGPAGITLYTVGTVKPVPIDGGWRHYVVGRRRHERQRPHRALRRRLLGAHRLPGVGCPARARSASRASTASPATSSSTPSTCPHDVAPGDLLAVAATGAYCWSLASNYNHVPRPAVVAVRDGAARVIVRGETEADLLARDAGLDASDAARRASRMIEYRTIRVALLGAGSVGVAGGAPPARARRRARAAHRRAHRARRHRRARHWTPGATSTSRRPAHDRRRVAHPRLRHRDRAHGRHRAGPHARARRDRLGRRRRSPATRRCSRTTAPSCSPPPSRWAPSSTTRRPSAARSRSSGRCATASPATGSSASSAS